MVLEIFKSIQGEGIYTGNPSIFIRFRGCNLRCVFGKSRCDTPYSSFELEESAFDSVKSVIDEVNRLNGDGVVKHLVITGGEPLLHRDELWELIKEFGNNYLITVETNGTLLPIEGAPVFWSISPKLSTSVDKELRYLTKEQAERHDKTRINEESLKAFSLCKSVQLKFVYSGQESLKEIEEIVEMFKSSKNKPHILLMPEGTTNEQLSEISKECAYVCISKGWTFCDRLHIRIWGDRRGV